MADVPAPNSELLAKWETSDGEAFRRSFPLIYDELRRLASHYLRNERPGQTHWATARLWLHHEMSRSAQT